MNYSDIFESSINKLKIEGSYRYFNEIERKILGLFGSELLQNYIYYAFAQKGKLRKYKFDNDIENMKEPMIILKIENIIIKHMNYNCCIN